MVMSTFYEMHDHTLDIEGGFANRSRKADPGGPTNFGITQATLSAWRKRPVSVNEIKQLTIDEALEIYKAEYWDVVRGDDLPLGLDYAVFDFAVNSGPSRASKEIQRLVGAYPDGVIGVITLQAISNHPGSMSSLISKYQARRLAFMKRLKNWGYNKNGWSRRVARVEMQAIELASQISVTPDVPLTDGGGKAKPDPDEKPGCSLFKWVK